MILGEEESVLFREVSSFQGCPYRGVPLYTNPKTTPEKSCVSVESTVEYTLTVVCVSSFP